ncbi:metal ABC transporter substrate-binding protein [Alsobacter sp. R-9]
MIDRRRALVAIAAVLAAGTAVPARAQTTRLPVVATFSILGDFVRVVGGDRVALTTLVGPNGDAHVFQPTPADAKALAGAKLVVVNGLGFEGWLDRLVKASGTKATVAVATNGIMPIAATDDGHDHGKGHDHGRFDPHAWQSVPNAKVYVAQVRDALVAADPAGKEAYEANAASYLARLDALDAEIRAAVARIPASRRRIITSHDAFGYFAKAYGIIFVSPLGVSTEAEASARDVARIIRQIRAEAIPAVFLENVTDPRLMDRITRETGAKVGGRLYSDALSAPDGIAGTYIDMMRSNIRELTTALSS